MNNKVFITCAVTGSGDTASKHPDLPMNLTTGMGGDLDIGQGNNPLEF